MLGEASDPRELFVVDECDDTELDVVIGKVKVWRLSIHKANVDLEILATDFL